MVQEPLTDQRTKNDDMNRDFEAGEIRAVEGEERTVELSFSSEEPYYRWFGPEILDHSDGCVDLNRLQANGCLLFNHDRDRVLGRVVECRIDGDKGRAKVRFDKDADSETIYQKVLCGTLTGVSVGYRVTNWEEVEDAKKSIDGRFTGPCSIAKRWEPFEISIVSVPADPTVGVGRSLENGTKDVVENSHETEDTDRRSLDWFIRQLQINTLLYKEEQK